MADDDGNEYLMGELRGDVNAILKHLEKIEQKIDNTHSTHSQGYNELEERIVSLEKFRSRILGGCAVVSVLLSLAYALVGSPALEALLT